MVPDGVDAAMDAMETPRADAVTDCIVGGPRVVELNGGEESVLAGRDPRDDLIGCDAESGHRPV